MKLKSFFASSGLASLNSYRNHAFLGVFLLVSVSGCGIRSIPLAENEVDASWAEVQNQYRRRADLIPNLVEVVKKYAAHEKETLEGVIAARAQATQMNLKVEDLNEANIKKYQQAQQGLSAALGRLMMVTEKYPDLKANENFKDLSAQIEGTENRVTVARNRYIVTVKNFNNLVTAPPESWTNSMFMKKEKKAQFAVEDLKAIEKAPQVKF